MSAHIPNPGLVPGVWSAEESTCSNSLKMLSSLSGGNPATNIADNSLNCDVSFDVESIRSIKDVCLSL